MLSDDDMKWLSDSFDAEYLFKKARDPRDPPERASMYCAVVACDRLDNHDPDDFVVVLDYMKKRLLKEGV